MVQQGIDKKADCLLHLTFQLYETHQTKFVENGQDHSAIPKAEFKLITLDP